MSDLILAVVLVVVGALVILGGTAALLFAGGSLGVAAYLVCMPLGCACILGVKVLQ